MEGSEKGWRQSGLGLAPVGGWSGASRESVSGGSGFRPAQVKGLTWAD